MRTALLALSVLGAASCGTTRSASTVSPSSTEVMLATDVTWEPLNPARGEKSPRAATLWGDRNGTGPTGFLVRFVDGFSSPPHIHNVSYRGVVIRGLVHNAEAEADRVWMPPGSYWTQPKGSPHITAAKGADTVAYIEIDEGPYLVRPVQQAFDVDEAPVNVDASRVAWVEAPGAGGAELASLWGDPKDDAPSGLLVKLPADVSGVLRGHGATLRAVVIQGRALHRGAGQARAQELEPGSSFASSGPSVHDVSCTAHQACVIYVRTEGTLEVSSAPPAGGRPALGPTAPSGGQG